MTDIATTQAAAIVAQAIASLTKATTAQGVFSGGGSTAGAVLANGTVPLTAAWNAGNFQINSQNSDRRYNVIAYGAVGNGSTDDTAAFQSANAAASAAGGGVVYAPGGYNFKLATASIFILDSGCHLRGDGPGATTITQGTGTIQVIESRAGASNVSVEGINFVGAAGAGNTYAILFGQIGTVTNCWVRSCRFTNFSAGGISFGQSVSNGGGLCADFLAENNEFIANNTATNEPFGLAVVNGQRGRITGNRIVGVVGTPRPAGVTNAGIDLEPNVDDRSEEHTSELQS